MGHAKCIASALGMLSVLGLLAPQVLAEMPVHTTGTLSEGRGFATAVSVDGKAVIASGITSVGGVSSTRVDIYDAVTDSWSIDSLSLGRIYMAGTSVRSLAIFAGGTNNDRNTVIYDRVDIYNAASGQWNTAALSQPRAHLEAATVGHRAYFAGGGVEFVDKRSIQNSDIIDIYDAESNQWSTMTMPRPRQHFGMAAVGEVLIFAGGWSTPGVLEPIIDIYNTQTDAWSTATISRPRYAIAATVVGDTAIFLGGWGGFETSPCANVDVYDAGTDSWASFLLPEGLTGASATSVGDLALFAGGWEGSHSDTVHVYDASSDEWSTTLLSQARFATDATSVGDSALFAGGIPSSSGLTDRVDFYTIPEPATVGLIALGLASLAARRRRR